MAEFVAVWRNAIEDATARRLEERHMQFVLELNAALADLGDSQELIAHAAVAGVP